MVSVNSKKFILIGVIIAILLAGVAGFLYLQNQKNPSLPPCSVSKAVLALTEEPQDAVFYIAPGWVGGGGSAPILDVSGKENRPQEFNYKPIFFDESKVEEVMNQDKASNCVRGQSAIEVKANITL